MSLRDKESDAAVIRLENRDWDRLADEGAGFPAGERALLRFAAASRLAVEMFFVDGIWLAMTNVELPLDGPTRKVTASGAGFVEREALSGCLGEALEICSWAFRPGDRGRLIRAGDLAGETRLDAAGVLGFSAEQIAGRDRLNRAWDGWDRIPPPEKLARAEHWTTVSSFDGATLAVCPAFLCYGYFGDIACGDPTANVDSNGCAAGPTPEEAKARAVLELVERDAAGIWWNRGCVRRRLAASAIGADLEAALARHRAATGRRVRFLDISTFASAVVVAAVSCDAEGGGMVLGFGSAFQVGDAARSAFLELVQCEVAISARSIRSARGGDRRLRPEDRRIERWLRHADIGNFPFVSGEDGGDARPGRVDGTGIGDLLAEIASACGKQVWFADLTRRELGVPAVKAICEGLAHYKLRRGVRRYAALPRHFRWRTTRAGIGRSDPYKLLL